jgi:hypothetical protein
MSPKRVSWKPPAPEDAEVYVEGSWYKVGVRGMIFRYNNIDDEWIRSTRTRADLLAALRRQEEEDRREGRRKKKLPKEWVDDLEDEDEEDSVWPE